MYDSPRRTTALVSLLRQILAARSSIVALHPLKPTVTEWTESRHWTESTETYEAKCTGKTSPGNADWHCLAAVPTGGKTFAGLPIGTVLLPKTVGVVL
jgi:hypothetical protein